MFSYLISKTHLKYFFIFFLTIIVVREKYRSDVIINVLFLKTIKNGISQSRMYVRKIFDDF